MARPFMTAEHAVELKLRAVRRELKKAVGCTTDTLERIQLSGELLDQTTAIVEREIARHKEAKQHAAGTGGINTNTKESAQ